jgi:hypothetical protein
MSSLFYCKRAVYCKYESCLSLTAYAAILALTLVAYNQNTSIYTDVVRYETRHWNVSAIKDIIVVNKSTECPVDTEIV